MGIGILGHMTKFGMKKKKKYCHSNNPLETSLNMESNSSFISFKLFNGLSPDHKRSQEHDFPPFLRKQVAKGMFKRHFQSRVGHLTQILSHI